MGRTCSFCEEPEEILFKCSVCKEHDICSGCMTHQGLCHVCEVKYCHGCDQVVVKGATFKCNICHQRVCDEHVQEIHGGIVVCDNHWIEEE